MRIFFCGGLGAQWMTGWQRCQVFKELGHNVIEFAQDPYHYHSLIRGVIKKITGVYFFNKTVLHQFNSDFWDTITAANPDIAWIEKALLLMPETLEKAKRYLPNCIFVCYQDDDPFGPNHHERPLWKYFKESIPLYHLHYVLREVNIKEFYEHGAQNVSLCKLGYYPALFHPPPKHFLPVEYHHEVSFVGTARDTRIQNIGSLIGQFHIPVTVYGNSWQRTLVYYRYKKHFHPSVDEQKYTSLIWQSKISLGFVSAANRSEYNGRTFEIPASRGFLLAQRTGKHLELYEEGKEAEFFSSVEECADKIRFYLVHETERLKIVQASYQRCIRSGYSLQHWISEALKKISVIRK